MPFAAVAVAIITRVGSAKAGRLGAIVVVCAPLEVERVATEPPNAARQPERLQRGVGRARDEVEIRTEA